LNVFEEDGTRSIRTVSREMGLSKSSVQRVPADNRRHPYHYTGVHLLPEDYPIRREFYLWLINQNDAPERELFPRGFQHRFSVNLWTGLLGDRLASISVVDPYIC
jgi:hypothetical protein